MKQLAVVSLFLLLGFNAKLHAQEISVNTDGSAPDESAMLDVVATDKGILIPRMTQAQRIGIANPATSLIVYQSDGDAGFYFNAGTPGTPSWVKLLSDNDLGEPITIQDADGDTKVSTETSNGLDNDTITFEINGSEEYIFNSGGQILMPGSNASLYIGNEVGDGNGMFGNVALGFRAFEVNQTAVNNVAIGTQSLGFKRTGNANTATGAYSMYHNTEGFSNTAFGYAAGYGNTTDSLTGNFNVFVGREAGSGISSGNSNVLIGYQSGFNIASASNNIFIGDQAGFNETSSNKLYIENSNSATPLIYGDFANDSLKVFGTFSVDSAKDGSGYTFPGLRGTNGQILTSNGSGKAIWQDAPGDDLGSHIATTRIQLNDHKISNDGDNEGLSIEDDGQITGTPATTGAGNAAFMANGDYRTNGQGTGYYFANTQIGITGNNGNSGDMRFITGTNTRMQITTAGQVKINTTSPSTYQLDVNGSFSANTMNVNDNYTLPNIDGDPNDVLQTDGSGNVSWADVSSTASPLDSVLAAGNDAGGDSILNLSNLVIGNNTNTSGASIEITNNSGNPLVINRNAAGAFTQGFRLRNSAMTNGNVYNMVFGKEESLHNSAYIGFRYFYNNSDSNSISFGLWQENHILNITAQRRLGINTSYPESTLDVAGKAIIDTLNVNSAFTFPSADGNPNEVLQTDGSGNVSWAEATSRTIEDADGDTKIQVEESTNEDVIRFDLGGTEFITIDTVVNTGFSPVARINMLNNGGNIVLGDNSGNDLANIGGNGIRNVIIGQNSGNGSTDVGNVFIGGSVANTGASSNNVAIGHNAAEFGANRSVAIGNAAGRAGGLDYSLAIGTGAASSVTASNLSTVIGTSSGASLTTGDNNTFLGANSGFSLTTGSNNVFIGKDAGYNETGSGKLYIENSNSSTPLIYGDFTNDTIRINGLLNLDSAKDGSGYIFPGNRGVAGQILQSDGSGKIIWASAASSAEWTASGQSLYASSISNRVGIGTSTIESNFKTEIEASSGSATKGLFIDNQANAGSNQKVGLEISLDAGSSKEKYGIINRVVGTSGSSDSLFGTYTEITPDRNTTSPPSFAYKANFLGTDGDNWGVYMENEDQNYFSGKLGVGVENPDSMFEVNGGAQISRLSIAGNYTFPNLAPNTANEVLQYDGTELVWKAVGINSSIEDADGDTKIQVEESSDEDVIRFDVKGTEYFRLDTGRIEFVNTGNSVFIGDNAGQVDDFSNNNNVFIGTNSGNQASTAFRNVAIGSGSMGSVISGNNNTAVGYDAIGSSTGSTLTAIGSAALKNSGSAIQSTAVGYSAGLNATGNANTIMGYAALGQNSSGSNNVAIGFAAGENNTGSNNIFLGYNSGANATESNVLYIDNSNTASPLIYGDFANDTVRVNGSFDATNSLTVSSDVNGIGIGRVAPSGNIRLDIYRSINNAEVLLESGGDNDVLYNLKSLNEHWSAGVTGSTKAFRIHDHGRSEDRLVIDQSGGVGIGTSDPSSILDVNGNIEIDSNGSAGDDAFYFGDPSSDGTWRIRRDGNDLAFERRESGVWVFKVKMNP